MKLFPAIDIRGGKCVRLVQGDFSKEKIYGADPVAQACQFEEQGAEFLHIVDLDAARTGEPVNRQIIGEICKSVSAYVQVGGGVRQLKDAVQLRDLGVGRVVVGTTAVEHPELLHPMTDYVEVAAGLDFRSGLLAIRGWVQDTEMDLLKIAEALLDSKISAIVATDIVSDGMLGGPDKKTLLDLLKLLDEKASSVELIASGGVADIEDLKALSLLQADGSHKQGKKLAGAIVGKAIYEGAMDVKSACLALKQATEESENE